MLQINEIEMYKVNGGSTLSYMFINAVTKAANTLYSLGQSIGSAIRRVTSGRMC